MGIDPGSFVLSLVYRGGPCTSFTVSSEEAARDIAPKGTVSSASSFNAKKWGTLRA
jgi:hypothetical protein